MSFRRLLYRVLVVASIAMWLGVVLVFRKQVSDQDVRFWLGIAPNFFAAIAFFFDAYLRNWKAVERASNSERETVFSWPKVSVYVFGLLFLGEILQEFVFSGCFDWFDLLATIAGLGFSVGVFFLTGAERQLNKLSPRDGGSNS